MTEQGVIRKVEEHTDWCSSLAFSTKKDGSIRICLDPQKLALCTQDPDSRRAEPSVFRSQVLQ